MTSGHNSQSVFIGIDLGGTTLKAALVSPTGEIIHETRSDTELRNPEALFKQVIETALTLRDHKDAQGQVAGIGIGIPGLVNRKTNRIEVMPNLPALSEIDITAELSNKTGLPVILDQDPNIAARTRERLFRDRTSSLSRPAIPRHREFIAEDIAHAAREGDEMAQVMM